MAKGKVGGIKLKGGEVVPAEVVILGVGVSPETTYLKESGWQLEKDGSLAVDKNFAVKGVPNAYAVGDIAKYPYVFLDDTPVRIEHWNVRHHVYFSYTLRFLGSPTDSL